jgi:signal transduction histidine kinase
MGDVTRLAQVVGNLLQNATKFTDPGGRVIVNMAVDARNKRAAVCVRDTGVGIDAKILPHIFDPFIQAEPSHARTNHGLGLGLALVKGLVELHGGAVSAKSVPGNGTEFTVRIPIAELGDNA